MNIFLRSVSIAAIGGLSLAACGLTDVSADDLRDKLVEDGIPEDTADCIVERLEAELSDDDFQTVAKADVGDEVDPELDQQAEDIINECVASTI
mgnify:CR=1 FL=1